MGSCGCVPCGAALSQALAFGTAQPEDSGTSSKELGRALKRRRKSGGTISSIQSKGPRAIQVNHMHSKTKAAAAALPLVLLLGAGAALLSGCTTTGMGGGDLVRSGKTSVPVLFSWTSKDGSIDGSMTATLPTATYQGRFFQITQTQSTTSLAPMWDGWAPGWTDWPYWGPPGGFDAMSFSTLYSGKVVANLRSPGGDSMRCRFHMIRPESGMQGGGAGECQLASGGTIQATF
ncbi:hypothetical protein SAMN05444747_11198 [Variovorax sp. OV329]|nr:hypothetical protein SAMN05444747_11198 [Variovorax sp. OV329]